MTKSLVATEEPKEAEEFFESVVNQEPLRL